MQPKSIVAPLLDKDACQMKDVIPMPKQQPARVKDRTGWLPIS